MNINVFILMTKAALSIPWLSAVKITIMCQISTTERDIMLQSTKYFDCCRTLQNIITSIKYVSAALNIFALKQDMLETNSFAPEITLCKCVMCSIRQASNSQKLNLNSTSNALRHYLLSMQTFSQILSRRISR